MGKKYNDLLVYVSTFLFSASFTLPIWTFYFTEYVEISLSQATFVWTLSSLAALLFEIPTWAWSDRFGRKKIALWGLLCIFLSSTTYLWARDFWVFVVNAFVNGFGSALVSGCVIGMIYDRYKERGMESFYPRFSSYKSVITFSGRAIAALFAAWLYRMDPLLPFLVVSVFLLWNIGVIAFMYDPSFERSTSRNSWRHIVDGWWYVRSHRGILYVLLFMILWWSFAADMLWSLYQPLATSWWVSKEIISYLYVLIGWLSALGSWFAGKMFGRRSTARLIMVYLLVQVVAWVMLLFPFLWLKFVAMLMVWFVFGFYMVVVPSYINKHIPSSHRVTVNSIEWFLYSWMYFVAWWSAGWLYNVLGEYNILIVNAVFPFIFLVLYVALPRVEVLYDAR